MTKTPKRDPLTRDEKLILHINAQPWARGCAAEMRTLWNEMMTQIAEQLVSLGVSEADRDALLSIAAASLEEREAHVLSRWTLPHVLALAKPRTAANPIPSRPEAQHG